MQFQSASAMHSGVELLRLDTDLGLEQGLHPVNGMPTPISATSNERKSSASSWSFITDPSSSDSQTSSASSYPFYPEPSTPEPNGLPTDFSSFSSASSFDTLCPTPDTLDHQSNYHSTSFTESSQDIFPTNTACSNVQWTVVPRSYAGIVYSLPTHGVESMMPACGDFATSLAASLMMSSRSLGASGTQDHGPSWQSQAYHSHYGSMAPQQQSTIPSQSNVHGWPLPASNILPSNADGSAITIAPSEAMPTACGYTSAEITASEVIDARTFQLPSPTCSDSEDIFCQEMAMKFHHAHAKSNSAFLPGRHSVMLSAGRVSKRPKQKRSTTANSRRSRPATTTIPGLNVECQMQQPKRQICQGIDKKTGQVCGKKFYRPEHLKRHEKIHGGEQEFFCPIPNGACRLANGEEFKCPKAYENYDPNDIKTKPLGRLDNWRDHLQTHLRVSAAGAARNHRCSPEVLYKAIRAQGRSCPDVYKNPEQTIEMVREKYEKNKSSPGIKVEPDRRRAT